MNNTLTNGFKLLELLADSESECSVSELAIQMDRPPSHICRLLKTLLQTGYVEQNPNTRKYRVTLRVLTLAHVRLSRLDFRRLGQPYALRLANELKAHVYLSQPLGGQSVVVDVAHPAGSVSDAGIVIGQIHSIKKSACGKLCAAYAGASERKRLELLLKKADKKFALDAWRKELEEIKSQQLAIRKEEGLLALAAPVHQKGGVFTGALGIYFPKGCEAEEQAVNLLQQAAGGISFALGFPIAL